MGNPPKPLSPRRPDQEGAVPTTVLTWLGGSECSSEDKARARVRLRGEVRFTAVRSRGPGGQNVNKVSSSAVLTWDYVHSSLLSSEHKEIIGARLASWLNRDGQITVRADASRDLERNKELCLDKVIALLGRALHKPKPRKATRPTKASKVRRRENKQRRGQTKVLRRSVER